ncbi:MAG: type II CAAX endopeptidase family protein [Terriglobia bacterium]
MNAPSDLPPLRESTDLPAEVLPSPFKPFPVWSGLDVMFLIFFTCFSAIVLVTLGRSISHFLQIKFSWARVLLHSDNEGMYLILHQAILDGVILLFIYFTITLKYNAPFLASIKWKPRQPLPIGIYFPFGIGLALAVMGLSMLFPPPQDLPIEKLLKQPYAAVLFASLGMVVAPFVEEVVFRGFIFPVVEGWFGSLGAVLATAVLFAGVHVTQLWGSWPAIALILLVGLTLSAVRARTDSLLPSFVIHFSYNTTICLLYLIGVVVGGYPA